MRQGREANQRIYGRFRSRLLRGEGLMSTLKTDRRALDASRREKKADPMERAIARHADLIRNNPDFARMVEEYRASRRKGEKMIADMHQHNAWADILMGAYFIAVRAQHALFAFELLRTAEELAEAVDAFSALVASKLAVDHAKRKGAKK